MHIYWARLASFCHLGFISDPLIVSKFHNETHDPKGQENKIYTIVKGRETFYRRHTVPVTSCSEVKYVLKGYYLFFLKIGQSLITMFNCTSSAERFTGTLQVKTGPEVMLNSAEHEIYPECEQLLAFQHLLA